MRKIGAKRPPSASEKRFDFIEANLAECVGTICDCRGFLNEEQTYQWVGDFASHKSWHPFEVIEWLGREYIPALWEFIRG